MAAPIIRVQGLGKRYVLRHQRAEPYTALRDVIANKARGLFKPNSASEASEFWALKDVNFQLRRGECLAVLGAKGANVCPRNRFRQRTARPHMHSFGALVATPTGKSIAGVAISMYEGDLTPAVEISVIKAVRALAGRLSRFGELLT